MALAIKDGNKMYDQHRRKPTWEFYMMTWEEIKRISQLNGYEVGDIDKRIENTNKIAKQIKVEIAMWQALFPNHQTPEEITEIYEKVEKGLISN
jgi:DNA polymerase III alpha subunit